jgi:hypothetical protein
MELLTNDILCFISTARHEKSNNEIVISVESFYDFVKIKEAKDLVYDLCKRKICRRKKDEKISKEIGDILSIFETIDEEKISVPRFVAERFDSLPPSSGFDAIARNMSALRELVANLRDELKELRDTCDTFISGMGDQADIKAELSDIKKKLIKIEKNNAELSSNNVAMPVVKEKTTALPKQKQSYSAIIKKQSYIKKASPPTEKLQQIYNNKDIPEQVYNMTPMKIDDWTTVGEKKKIIKENKRQDAKPEGNRQIPDNFGTRGRLRGAERLLDLYVGQCDLETTMEEIVAYCKNVFDIVIKEAVQLPSKSTYYKSFKLSMPYYDRDILLDSNWWPTGIYVRKFFKARNNLNDNMNYNENNNNNVRKNTSLCENKDINDDSDFNYADLC